MNRREFALTGGVGVAGIFFPRKTEGSDSELLSHEEMAQVILDHPHNVCLEGDADSFGRTRWYSYADEPDPFFEPGDKLPEDKIDEWKDGASTIVNNHTWGHGVGDQIKSVIGCRVEVRHHNRHQHISREEWFDISNPRLKIIHCVGHPEWSNEVPRIITRYFCRIGQQWREL